MRCIGDSRHRSRIARQTRPWGSIETDRDKRKRMQRVTTWSRSARPWCVCKCFGVQSQHKSALTESPWEILERRDRASVCAIPLPVFGLLSPWRQWSRDSQLFFFCCRQTPQVDTVTRRVDGPGIHACRRYEHQYTVPHLSDAFNFADQGYLAVTDLAQRQDTLPRRLHHEGYHAVIDHNRRDSSTPFASITLAQHQGTLLGAGSLFSSCSGPAVPLDHCVMNLLHQLDGKRPLEHLEPKNAPQEFCVGVSPALREEWGSESHLDQNATTSWRLHVPVHTVLSGRASPGYRSQPSR